MNFYIHSIEILSSIISMIIVVVLLIIIIMIIHYYCYFYDYSSKLGSDMLVRPK